MVRRLSGGRAEMLLAGVRESWSNRRESWSSNSSSEHGDRGNQLQQSRRLSPWSRFAASNRDEGGSGARGGAGAGRGGGNRDGGVGNASFGTLELFANLDLENLAPAKDDDSDEEVQRARAEGGHVVGRQHSPKSPKVASSGGDEDEARRFSDGDAERVKWATTVDENRRKSVDGAGSAESSRKLPPAGLADNRSASVGFMPTRATGALNYSARIADNKQGAKGADDDSPRRLDYSRPHSTPKDAPSGGAQSYRSDPRAARSQQSSSLTSSTNSQVDPSLLASVLQGVQQEHRRPPMSKADSAWSVVEAELEAVGSCASPHHSKSRLDVDDQQDDHPKGGNGPWGSRSSIGAVLGNLIGAGRRTLEGGGTLDGGSSRPSEEGGGGGGNGDSVTLPSKNNINPRTASSRSVVPVAPPLGGYMPRLGPGKSLDCWRRRSRGGGSSLVQMQRRRSIIGCVIAAVALVATGGAAFVLVRSNEDGGGGRSEVAPSASSKAETTAAGIDGSGEKDEEEPSAHPFPANEAVRRPRAPPIPPDLLDLCSPSRVYFSADGARGYGACRSICEGAECCYLPPDHVLSCASPPPAPAERAGAKGLDGEAGEDVDGIDNDEGAASDPCRTFVRVCAILDAEAEAEAEASTSDVQGTARPQPPDNTAQQQGAGSGQDASASPPPDPDVLRARCSLQAIQPASGYSKCWDLCEEALCCFEGEEGVDSLAVAMVLEGRSAAYSTRQQEQVDRDDYDKAVDSCRDDCALFGPCRSLLQATYTAGAARDPADDVYVVEEEGGALLEESGQG